MASINHRLVLSMPAVKSTPPKKSQCQLADFGVQGLQIDRMLRCVLLGAELISSSE
ncbi:hypothetical protein SAMN05216344_10311 [Polaromonas sp. OV174]|uniref:hypothetical protein n=1 Tax=Polaromonas sp. OV174 TaxID=1855300 RepID=UPI0008E6B5C8|nr:hypothetical protein [Polaromonas sp. OV174]SFB77273.1 hypothetical protein SAMN05216344_10311 [Polaromonas sp. OV174]